MVMRFSLVFSDEAIEKAALSNMRRASTGNAFGGQFYLVRFDGVVEGDGSDGSVLRVSNLVIIRPIGNVFKAVENAMDARSKDALRPK